MKDKFTEAVHLFKRAKYSTDIFYAFTLLLFGFGWLNRDKRYKATIENDNDLNMY